MSRILPGTGFGIETNDVEAEEEEEAEAVFVVDSEGDTVFPDDDAAKALIPTSFNIEL